MDDFHRHFIRINEHNYIVALLVEGFHEIEPTDILINAKGDTFLPKLHPDGEENSPLHTDDGIHLYDWNPAKATADEPWRGVVERTEEEIEADRAAIAELPQPPTIEDRVKACEEAVKALYGVQARQGIDIVMPVAFQKMVEEVRG